MTLSDFYAAIDVSRLYLYVYTFKFIKYCDVVIRILYCTLYYIIMICTLVVYAYNTGNGSAVGDNRAMRILYIVQNNGNRLVNSAFNPVRRRWRFLWPAAQGRTQTQNIASTAAEGLRVFVATLHIIIIIIITRTHALYILLYVCSGRLGSRHYITIYRYYIFIYV